MTEENQSSAVRKPNVKWRVVDIVVAAIVAVASGVIFWAWDFIYAVPTALFDSLTPGLGGLFHFMWLFAGPLVAIIIRKPGAAFFGETIAAVIETLLGNPFGVAHALLIGMAQGLGAEIGFAVFAYRKWNLLTVTLAGALTGLSNGLYEWVVTAGWSTLQGVVFTVCCVISGAVFGGALMWFVQKALAKTGVLDRFESGKADVVARTTQLTIQQQTQKTCRPSAGVSKKRENHDQPRSRSNETRQRRLRLAGRGSRLRRRPHVHAQHRGLVRRHQLAFRQRAA